VIALPFSYSVPTVSSITRSRGHRWRAKFQAERITRSSM
jgi:hypothetical protein